MKTKKNDFRLTATTVFMLLVVLAAFYPGCGRPRQASVPVAPDCQKFLDKYFNAARIKDVPTIAEMSSIIPPAQREGLPEGSADMMIESKKKMTAEALTKMLSDLGDIKGYSVVSVKATPITDADVPMVKMTGPGTQTELTCLLDCSKKDSAHLFFNLFQESSGSDFYILAWRYQAEL